MEIGYAMSKVFKNHHVQHDFILRKRRIVLNRCVMPSDLFYLVEKFCSTRRQSRAVGIADPRSYGRVYFYSTCRMHM